jgi:hypothetical protein
MNTTRLLSRTLTVFGVLTAAGMMLSFSYPAIAQQTGAGSLLDTPQSGDGFSSDPFSGNGSNQVNGVFNIINRAILAPTTSQSDFFQQQQENLGQEAADFRARQQELLRQDSSQQPSSTPSTPTN